MSKVHCWCANKCLVVLRTFSVWNPRHSVLGFYRARCVFDLKRRMRSNLLFFPWTHRAIHQNIMHLQYAYRHVLGRNVKQLHGNSILGTSWRCCNLAEEKSRPEHKAVTDNPAVTSDTNKTWVYTMMRYVFNKLAIVLTDNIPIEQILCWW